MDMKSQRCHWICLVIVTLSVLLWYVHMTRSDGSNSTVNIGLQGYLRITPGRRDQFLKMHCRQCALVSSSGQMQGASLREEIDQMGCVIRMNNAPTLGYERDVGSRTSLRVVSHTSVPLLIKNESYYFRHSADTTYVFWGPERNMRQDGKGRVFNALMKMATKYPQVKIYMVTREKIQYCDSVFQNETGKNRMNSGAFLSTGFFTMILAMDMCDSIHVYGMIDDNFCSRADHSVAPYHYYEGSRMDECRMYRMHEHASRGGHRFITEKAIYARWALHHRVEFKHPSWNLQERKHDP
ncbi:alpha-N-acetyl-neuraminyl-2,3-beta-galactosyl-1,3-N-acetyl-galactosaminide alpha-2,6-sialyltransferase [Oncorhynchus nerka]|uniref:alpha-N-acetyl-neuraminyl-2,3-beta-galactosyl-1, 3-N-acetyl-galactosaminide alpha-2,6-sialyltransferase n=1 Tax=Oncorhynchus nerka TaxID=8023 RepID=UPI0011321523|nr:alpha-N-acetylgalactosaminide alpha-2,6-sialyltransferase 3-like [Oncorhynchus nerka]XP_029504438.1 alpha-N-acetylgalactosaminide alpha-2,6-sialyltransferase 3-like [Oncorhynchus nerka]